MIDFYRFIEDTAIETLHIDLDFKFTPEIIKNSTNFQNPELSFTKNLIKSFYRIQDLYSSMTSILKFFPREYRQLLFTNSFIVMELIDCYFYFLNNIRHKWIML